MPARSTVLAVFFFFFYFAAPLNIKLSDVLTLCPDPHTCLNLNLPKPYHPNDPAWGQGDLNAAILLV